MNRVAALIAAFVALVPLAATASEECIQLALVSPHAPQVEPADAQVLINDLNATRATRGLPPLTEDARLSQFALAVAQQMARRHYFGHTDPNGVTFQDRLRGSGFAARFAAENMAFDQDERHAQLAFLHSPGHFGNMVDPHPRHVGAAVVAAGDGEVFFVEEFSD